MTAKTLEVETEVVASIKIINAPLEVITKVAASIHIDAKYFWD